MVTKNMKMNKWQFSALLIATLMLITLVAVFLAALLWFGFKFAATRTAVPANLTSGIGMEMVWLPAGYWAGKYEVTQQEYEKVIGNNPSNYKGPRKPVEMVSWNDAMEFCQRLTENERAAGKLPKGYAYTLPTEKQWEYFVGDAQLSDAVTSEGGTRTSSANVGSKGANQFGLHDVRGNVWEWCADWYSHNERVLRGPSWFYDTPDSQAVSSRLGFTPVKRSGDAGFRCVLVSVGGGQ